jgi:hypothetical protein
MTLGSGSGDSHWADGWAMLGQARLRLGGPVSWWKQDSAMVI